MVEACRWGRGGVEGLWGGSAAADGGGEYETLAV